MTEATDKTARDDELRELRAKRAALAAAREAREAQRIADEQIAAEKQDVIDNEAIEAAEIAHGPVGKKIMVVKTDLGAIIVRRPKQAAFKRFQDTGSLKYDELEKLVRPSVVHPSLSAFDQIMEELPATMLRCADAVSVLAGVRRDDVSAK